jgi:hypothetical protein
MSQQYISNDSRADPIPCAWIEAIEKDHIFIGTNDCIAGFSLQDLPPRWGDRFMAPGGNLILAQEIDCRGSPAATPFDLVTRLVWPLTEDPPRNGQSLDLEPRGGPLDAGEDAGRVRLAQLLLLRSSASR